MSVWLLQVYPAHAQFPNISCSCRGRLPWSKLCVAKNCKIQAMCYPLKMDFTWKYLPCHILLHAWQPLPTYTRIPGIHASGPQQIEGEADITVCDECQRHAQLEAHFGGKHFHANKIRGTPLQVSHPRGHLNSVLSCWSIMAYASLFSLYLSSNIAHVFHTCISTHTSANSVQFLAMRTVGVCFCPSCSCFQMCLAR